MRRALKQIFKRYSNGEQRGKRTWLHCAERAQELVRALVQRLHRSRYQGRKVWAEVDVVLPTRKPLMATGAVGVVEPVRDHNALLMAVFGLAEHVRIQPLGVHAVHSLGLCKHARMFAHIWFVSGCFPRKLLGERVDVDLFEVLQCGHLFPRAKAPPLSSEELRGLGRIIAVHEGDQTAGVVIDQDEGPALQAAG